jgi:hypothetical protein
MPIAGDGVTGAGESGETVRIHMRQVSVTATRSGAPLPVARVGDATGQRAAMLATPWHGRAGLAVVAHTPRRAAACRLDSPARQPASPSPADQQVRASRYRATPSGILLPAMSLRRPTASKKARMDSANTTSRSTSARSRPRAAYIGDTRSKSRRLVGRLLACHLADYSFAAFII